jgi:hypothetical protein
MGIRFVTWLRVLNETKLIEPSLLSVHSSSSRAAVVCARSKVKCDAGRSKYYRAIRPTNICVELSSPKYVEHIQSYIESLISSGIPVENEPAHSTSRPTRISIIPAQAVELLPFMWVELG